MTKRLLYAFFSDLNSESLDLGNQIIRSELRKR